MKKPLHGLMVAVIVTALDYAAPVSAIPDLRFDVVTFCCNCTGSILCQPQFNNLNFPTTNGHYIAMGTDEYRYELASNGNALAIYYNSLNGNYPAFTAAELAATIDGNSVSNFTSTGPKPDWIVLNEISTSQWETNADYREWLEGVVELLDTNYGYNVVLYSPFPNPGYNSPDWQIVSSYAFIAVENYLSGQQIAAENFSVSWCQSQYQSSIASYENVGVPVSRLILGEDYAETVSGAGYARSGVSSNQWVMAINARSAAAANCAFVGDIGYDWGNDDMNLTTNEMIFDENVYAANPLPMATGLTAPSILIQPQSQNATIGGSATFVVFQSGVAPTTFQWQFDGKNLAGATASSLTLTNAQVTNAGNYTVILSNAVGSVTSSNAYLTVGVAAPIAFDPFAPASTSYAPGANLIGQSNATGYWTQAGPSGAQPVLQAGSLAVGGLDGPSGNSVVFGGNGVSARFNPIPGISASSGVWFYSFTVNLANITTLNSSGVFWAGFNDSIGTQTTTPTDVATRVVTRSATGGYNIGLDKSSGTASDFVFSPAVFTTNAVVFLVGSYTFNTSSTNDDVSQLWINPPASTFGLATAPAATLTNNSGTDLSQIASFVLFNRNNNEPASIIADEVRIGTSWSSVTPPAEVSVAPSLSLYRAGSNSILSWTTNAPGFLLQSANALSGMSAWTTISGLVYTPGSQYIMTNVTSASGAFYRLQMP